MDRAISMNMIEPKEDFEFTKMKWTVTFNWIFNAIQTSLLKAIIPVKRVIAKKVASLYGLN